MSGTETVAAYFDFTPAQIRRCTRQRFLVSLAFAVAFAAPGVVCCVLGVRDILHGWLTADWDTLLRDVSSVLEVQTLVMMAYFYLFRLEGSSGRLGEDIAALRHAALSGDAVAAPEATLQPAPLAAEDLPIGPAPFRALRRSTAEGKLTLILGVGWLVLGVADAVLAVLDALAISSNVGIQPIAPNGETVLDGLLQHGVSAPVFVVIAVSFLLRVKASRRQDIVADEWGVRWGAARRGGEPHALAWHDVRAFVVFKHRDGANEQWRRLYALIGSADVLVWDTAPARPHESAEHERFARLIAARIALPLRDLSERVAALDEDAVSPRPSGLELPPIGFPTITRATAPRPKRSLWRRIGAEPALGVVLVLVPAMLLIGAVGFGLAKYQEIYFGGLPGRIQAEHPLAADALATPDALWPILPTATSSGSSSYRFADGAYQIYAGSDEGGTGALSLLTYGDAAVAVTLRTAGGSGDAANVGLLMRAAGSPTHPDTGVLFQVEASGHFDLESLGAQPALQEDTFFGFAYEQSDAIHTGLGATNRLLLVMRGRTFLCYINGQFVGSAYDRAGAIPPMGAIGFFVNTGDATGIFTDLAVYPVQSAASLLYV